MATRGQQCSKISLLESVRGRRNPPSSGFLSFLPDTPCLYLTISVILLLPYGGYSVLESDARASG